ncbi:urease accessory protein UreE [Salinicola peritrichatus]|uniref:urease accessory protein UreE n=1 Tax=Salinicola peritrichatus TaxID=1267424 RepID=UPI000DA15E21|nr:urease accessory protein UreE [Salinicola peritrichatus]
MLLVHKISGHCEDKAFAGRYQDRLWISAADAGRRRLRITSEGGETVGIDLPHPNWLCEGAVLHDDGRRIIVVARRPELVMVIALGTINPEMAFRIGHALGNRHSPAELRNNEILVPVTDSPDLTARPVLTLGIPDITLRFEERAFAAGEPPNGVAAVHEHHHD